MSLLGGLIGLLFGGAVDGVFGTLVGAWHGNERQAAAASKAALEPRLMEIEAQQALPRLELDALPKTASPCRVAASRCPTWSPTSCWRAAR